MYAGQTCRGASSTQIQTHVRGGVPNTCQQQRKGAGGSALLKPGPRVILTDTDLLRIRLKLT